MTALTLRGLEAAYKATEKVGATPHRTPDFRRLKKLVDPDAPIKGRMWFIEEHNTGYPGVLYRWQFVMANENGNEITVWADLLPELITSPSGKPVEPLVETR